MADNRDVNAGPTTQHASSATPPPPLMVAEIRYGVNWQWTAVKMQYERLMARNMLGPGNLVEEALREHMRGVVDMDFFVTAVRRLLRVAVQARRTGCDTSGYLKLRIKVFMSRWEHVIEARNALEHFDSNGGSGTGSAIFPVQSSDSHGRWKFIMPSNSVDVQELFKAAEDLCKAICKTIEPYEE